MAFKRIEPVKEVVKPVETVDYAGRKALREQAIHMVKNQHGSYVNRLRNYDELIADAERQIGAAIDANKTF